jgi:hypothetical protein
METATRNALWLVSLVSEKGQMSFSLISKLEKYYPQLVPFWGSVVGIPFLWLSLGLFSKWLPKLIRSGDQKEVNESSIILYFFNILYYFDQYYFLETDCTSSRNEVHHCSLDRFTYLFRHTRTKIQEKGSTIMWYNGDSYDIAEIKWQTY